MTVSAREIRVFVAREIKARTGWMESRASYDLFGRDTRPLRNEAFAVGVPDSAAEPLDRQRASTGMHTHTAVGVKWSMALGLGGPDDYDAALLRGEERLLAALEAIPAGSMRNLGVSLLVLSMTRSVPAGDESYLTGEIRMMASHMYPLA